MYHALFYDYVENIIERRAPFRAEHFALAKEFQERGEFVMGGAFDAPPDGALIVFRTDDPAVVEGFVKRDPYVRNGLVTKWRIRPWVVVIGG